MLEKHGYESLSLRQDNASDFLLVLIGYRDLVGWISRPLLDVSNSIVIFVYHVLEIELV
jgi:hypothetical protein